MRIEDILLTHARRTPDAVACATSARTVSYRELDLRSAELAAAFARAGIRPGDRVVVALANGAALLAAMFATARANLVMVPVNPAATAAELGIVLDEARARAMLFHPGTGAAEAAATRDDLVAIALDGTDETALDAFVAGAGTAPPPIAPSPAALEPWLLAYTSGSTGRPKGVVLSHRAKYLSAVTEALDAGLGPDDVALVNTPMFHVHGLVLALTLMAAGGSILFSDTKAAAEVLEAIAARKVTQLAMVPTNYRAFVDAATTGRELDGVRIARCTGAPLTATLREDILARFPALPLTVLYGATEAGAVSTLRTADLARKAGSVGQAMMGVEIEARDAAGAPLPPGAVGEIHIRSDYISSGYAADGALPSGEYRRWISLGDIGSVDEEGFLFLRGRASDIIISGGENVSAPEVEAAIERHPAVLAAAVVGVPDPYWGEAVKAFVELRPGDTAAFDEIVASAAEVIARFKLPKTIKVVPALPRNAFGKIDKKALKVAPPPAQEDSR